MSELLESLDENQRKAALALVGPVRIIAGAGSGKTKTIIHRIAYGVETGVYSPEKVLALSFTSKAAGEMSSRLEVIGVKGVACRTFHSAALRQLTHFWPNLIGGDLPNVRAGKARTLTEASEQLGSKLNTEVLRGIASEIEWRKVRLITPEDYASIIETRPLPTGITQQTALALMERYEKIKDSRREIDFEDVLVATLGMLQRESWVAERVREQFRFLVVDEYQDVSPVQRALLEVWRGDREDLCVVGDPNQTIYSFTGASADHLLRFETEFEKATTITLDRNYRSTKPIVQAAAYPVADTEFVAKSVRDSGEEPALISAKTDEEESERIATACGMAIKSGVSPSEIAILYRINSQSLAIETALAKAGIAFRVRGSKFFDNRAVREAMILLRAAATERPPLSAVSAIDRISREHFGWISRAPENPAERQSWSAVNEIARLAESMGPGATALDLLDDLTRRAELDSEPNQGAVTLSTIHQAKGLEWGWVFIIGMSEGLLPISFAGSPEAIAEESRLAYVGMTRAVDKLILSWAERATPDSAIRSRSRFIPPELPAA